MFTHKLLTVALVATFTLTACNSSTTKPNAPENLNESQIKGVAADLIDDNTGKPFNKPHTKKVKNTDFSVIYSKFDQATQEITNLEEGDRLQEGDLYKIKITAAKDCFIYVFQIDGKGKFFNLIEHGDKRFKFKQLDAGQELDLPRDDRSYRLDSTKGMENIFVVVSDKKDPSLENFYKKLSTKIIQSNKKSPDDVKETVANEKGPKEGVVSNETGATIKHGEINLEGKVSEQKISCEEQRACANSISFFNNM